MAAEIPAPADLEVIQPFTLLCPNCRRDISGHVLVMTGLDQQPLPVGPGNGPILLHPVKCPSCGYAYFRIGSKPSGSGIIIPMGSMVRGSGP